MPDSEPGSPLIVNGQLVRPDGKTPAAGVIVYAYQTGADGLYGPSGNSNPRLKGWVKTDPEGRFRFDTIRPAPYPNNRIAAHIHFQAWGGGVPIQYTEELLFEEDPFIQNEVRAKSNALGPFAFIRKVESGQVSIRLLLKPHADRMEGNILHGLRACGYKE